MIVAIRRQPFDDRTFLTAVSGLLARLVNDFEPDQVCAIRLSKWFDHKWLGYSGRGRVAFPYGYPHIDIALDEHFQDKITLPPFNPKQVTAEYHWRKTATGYTRLRQPDLVHRRVLEHSSANLHRRISSRWPSIVLMWFSSNTGSNEQGSVMVYALTRYAQSIWYASFARRGGWRVDRVKGVRKEKVQEWFPLN